MLGIPEGPNRVVLTRGLSSGTAGTCKRGVQDLGLPRHLCWQQDQGLSLGSLAGSQQVSTKATFLATSLSWSTLCKIRFKIREQSASLRAEVSRSRYPRTSVVGDAVEAMPGSSIDHAEECRWSSGGRRTENAHVLSILIQHPQNISTKSSITTQIRTGVWATVLIGPLTPPGATTSPPKLLLNIQLG